MLVLPAAQIACHIVKLQYIVGLHWHYFSIY